MFYGLCFHLILVSFLGALQKFILSGGHEVALPHLFNPECQEAVPGQVDVLAEQAFQYLIPK